MRHFGFGFRPRLCAAILLTATYFAVFFASSAAAQISVDGVIMRFSIGQRPVHNVNVRNNSDKVGYVTVEVEAVQNPGPNEVVTKSTELLASPKAFSIEPRGVRTVRLLLQAGATDVERVFRVSFLPQDRDFGEEFTQTKDKRNTVIRVLSGMGMLVFADPKKPNIALTWHRTGERLVFVNRGNVNIYLGDGVACPPGIPYVRRARAEPKETPTKRADGAGADSCTPLPAKRLYAGDEFVLNVPNAHTITYLRSDGGTGEYQREVVPGGDGQSVQTAAPIPLPENVEKTAE